MGPDRVPKNEENAEADRSVRYIEHGPDAKIEKIDHMAEAKAIIKVPESARRHNGPMIKIRGFFSEIADQIQGDGRDGQHRHTHQKCGRAPPHPERGARIVHACDMEHAGPDGKTFPCLQMSYDPDFR